MNRPSKSLLIAVTLLLTLACLAGTASACPNCKDALASDPAYSNLVVGYFWSILFMMSMPFIVFSGVAAYFYYEIRCRERGRQSRRLWLPPRPNRIHPPVQKSPSRADPMKAFGRLLQVLGLVLLPLSLFMNLTDSFSETFHIVQMLIMTAFGFAAFYLGRIVEGYASR